MIIERIQVEEGFLNGLDLKFDRGLNVLIGPRGAGKTSIIELIRFCLGAPALTAKAEQTSREHALSILGSGRVTVTLTNGNDQFTISRTSEHWTKSPGYNSPPLVLSQNEIESVALHATGRLKLLDSIHPPEIDAKNAAGEETLLSYIRSQSEERKSVSAELQTLRLQVKDLTEAIKEAEPLKKQHSEALASIEKASAQTQRLSQLGSTLATLSVRTGLYQRTSAALHLWRNKISALTAGVDVEPWPQAAGGDDPLNEIRTLARQSQQDIESSLNKVDAAISKLNILVDLNTDYVLKFEEEARTIRRQLEDLQQGAGAIAAKLSQLQEKSGQLSAFKALEERKLERLKKVQAERKQSLDQLEEIRAKRFEDRATLVSQLNKELGPRIHLSIERAGQTTEYASAIVNSLRGSGLRFNEVAPLIADQMSPREFVEAVEAEDFMTLSNVTGINPTRAAKIIERINEQGVESILTAPIEDGVGLSLLDGAEYKTTEHLSTGQRCTVVLPLLLMQQRLSLVLDQPEDHLDNAFVVETLIKVIRQRKADGQLIFSTHNANIPVLGEADRVILLGSDGSRGFVRHAERLDNPKSIDAITNVMEGGLSAFDKRSTFYHANL